MREHRSPKKIEINLPHDSRLDVEWIVEDLMGFPAADQPKIQYDPNFVEGLKQVYAIIDYDDWTTEYYKFGPWGWTPSDKEEVQSFRPEGTSDLEEQEG